MRQRVVKTLATISFLAAIVFVATASAAAQSLADPIRVSVPFDFIVADKTLPAGEYYVRRFQQYTSDNVVAITSVDGHTRVVRLTNTVQTLSPKKPVRLVFHRYGDQHFLYQVWPAGASTGRQLPRSHSEDQIAQKTRDSKNVAMNQGPEVETVSITIGPQ